MIYDERSLEEKEFAWEGNVKERPETAGCIVPAEWVGLITPRELEDELYAGFDKNEKGRQEIADDMREWLKKS